MITLEEPYKLRPIRYLGLWALKNWRMKVYGIAYDKDMPQANLINAAKRIAEQTVTQCDETVKHYNVGFVGIHEGKTGNFVFISWWANENELHHHVYTSVSEQPEDLVYMTPTGLAACTWDLRVMCFERDAWVDSVLKKYPEPDIEDYLKRILNADT
ncbi:MAG: isochorismatase [Gammaproteobacteria bacterium]|jgi:hypothetical protein